MFFVEALADFSQETLGQQEQNPQQKFISFKKGDKIYTKQTHENGWWLGFTYKENTEIDDFDQGYFPSTYVQKIVPHRPTEPHPSTLIHEKLKQDDSEEQDALFDYKKYAESLREEETINKVIHEILKEQTEVFEAQSQIKLEQIEKARDELQKEKDFQLLQQVAQQDNAVQMQVAQDLINEASHKAKIDLQNMPIEQQQQFGVDGYKKIKVTADNKQSILANPEIKYDEGAEYAYVSIKSQGQVAKAYRQMNHYFDYDKWNDQINQQGGMKKAKPDPSRKKDKKKEKLEKFLGSIQ